ncbi:MAG: glycosyltransferase [Lachnospiraceae bacterium]|nr:glycosyltransferase [Lachnospiraceae bacterium]
MPTVSVVVPVYNMEKYLDRCMDALFAQTQKDMEIILVDDGSTDSSAKMCDDIGLYHGGVSVIHQRNKGLTAAWKAGSRAATGEYIGYVDADDYIDADMFERLYERAKEKDADIVCCGLEHLYEQEPERSWKEQMLLPADSYDEDSLRDQILPGLINNGSFMGRSLMPNRVTKLVRRQLVQENLELCEDEVSIGEDFQFSLCMFLDAKRVEIIRDYFPYHYYMQPSSMTMKHDPSYMKKIGIMRKNLLRIAKLKGKEQVLSSQIWNDYLCLTVLYVKGIVYKQKKLPYPNLRKQMSEVVNQRSVAWALWHYDMPALSKAEKLFIFLMKREWYLLIYLCVRIYFR